MRECEYLIPALRGREPVTKDRDPFFFYGTTRNEPYKRS